MVPIGVEVTAMIVVDAVIVLLVLLAVYAGLSVRMVQQYQLGVVFRFGRVLDEIRKPGLARIVPVADRMRRVNVQIVTMPIPAQEGITRDNVTVRVDAVVYFRVIDPVKAIVNVQDYGFAMSQVAQTSLRSIIGKSELDDLLANREPLNQGLELMLDSPALGWGIEIDRVEIKDVALPESMKRSMARQAEADRERRARIITADGEFQASARLSEAAKVMSATPAALQLRLLQTVVEVAAEKNSTLVLPFPVELLRFLESSTERATAQAAEAVQVAEAVESAHGPDRAPDSGAPGGTDRATDRTDGVAAGHGSGDGEVDDRGIEQLELPQTTGAGTVADTDTDTDTDTGTGTEAMAGAGTMSAAAAEAEAAAEAAAELAAVERPLRSAPPHVA